MLSVYENLLRLYPAEHREHFGEEMVAVFRELMEENEGHGAMARGALWMREIAGLLCGALREHLQLVIGDRGGLALSIRRFTMRDGFRFPKTTWVLMMIILAGVVLAIHKGEVIATSLPPFSQPVTPIQPAHSYLLPGVVAGFLFFYAAGLAGWAIVFALRRSGVHRLDQTAGQK